MISRTAENCFWLSRNIERVLMLTNAIDVAYNVELETFKDAKEVWFPLVIVTGGEKLFIEKYGKEAKTNSRKIQEFLIWDKENPSSVYASFSFARENARIVRDLISADMWEEMNEIWLWINSPETQKISMIDLLNFGKRIVKFCFTWIGYYHNFILRDDPYNFMKLGMLIERADFTLRLGDVYYHRDINLGSMHKSMSESQYWQEMLLYSMSNDAFMRKSELELTRIDVAKFLLRETDYPRTIPFCLKDALFILKKMSRGASDVGSESKERLTEIVDYIEETPIEELLQNIHNFVTHVIDKLSELSSCISKEFFVADVSYYIAMLENDE